MRKKIDYYLSLVSPWSYLGHRRFLEIAEDKTIPIFIYPIDFSIVFPSTGGVPLPQRSQQRQDYRMQELRRWREFLSLPLTLKPKFFPVNDELEATMVIALREHDMGKALKFAGACLSAVWVDDRDISDRATLLEIAKEQSIDGNSLLTRFEEMRSIRRLDSENAIRSGIFGAPTYVTDGEVFWGQDRLELLKYKLRK